MSGVVTGGSDIILELRSIHDASEMRIDVFALLDFGFSLIYHELLFVCVHKSILVSINAMAIIPPMSVKIKVE